MGYKSDNLTLPDFVEDEEVRFLGMGIECQVFTIVQHKLVCKVYASHADARYCYTLQRIGFRAGVAPKPLALECNYYFSRYVEAYNTQYRNKNLSTCFEDAKETKKFRSFIDKVDEVFGGHWPDGHSSNIGIEQQEGKPKYIVIDFGVCGFGNTKLGKLLSIRLKVYK